jgi:hypothetical protein
MAVNGLTKQDVISEKNALKIVQEFIDEIDFVHDTLWTNFPKKRIFAAPGRENAKSVRKVTGFVDRHRISPKGVS